MSKKLISALLLVMLVASLFPVTFFAAETNSSGFEFSELSNEYALLKELGIAEDSDVMSKTVSRGEFALLAAKTLNIFNASGTSAAGKFSDVSSAHQYVGAISALVDMGILKGVPGGSFYPDNAITLEQAACVAVRIINADKALALTGSMTDYISVAAKHGILSGIVTSDYSRTAHRAEIYMILYNTLKTPVYIELYSNDANYTKDEDRTILTEYWNIKMARGLVYADNKTSVYGNRTDKEGSLNVQGKLFLSSTATTNNVVGREIEFYYYDDNKNPTICFAYIPDSKIVEISSEMIIKFDYLNGIYTADIDGKEKDFKIGDSYYLSYNGDAIDGSDPALMNPSTGSVTLIDNGSGVYNVVIVREYFNIILDYFDPYTNTLVDILDSSRNICIDDYTSVEGIDDYGKLSRHSVISVEKTPSGETLKLYPSKTTVVGAVTEYESADTVKITVSDRTLLVKGDVRFNPVAIETGNSYTFYLDYYGNAVYMTSGSMQSGIVLAYSGGTGLSERQCLVLTKSGEKKIFSFASGLNVRTPSGRQKVSAQDIASYVPEHTTVIYETNSKEQINEFILPMVINTEDEYKNLPNYPLFKVDYFLKNWPTTVSGAYQYREEINGFANWLILESATVMQIPVEPCSSYTDENTLSFGISELQHEYEVVVNPDPTSVKMDGEIEVYQTSGDFCAPSILVIHGGTSNVDVPLNSENLPYIVTSIKQGYDEKNDKAATKLEILGINGKKVSAFITDESLIERDYLLAQNFGGSASLHSNKFKLAVGDIVQISQRADDGNIGRIALLYDNTNSKLTYTDLVGYNKIFRLYAGDAILSHGSYFEYTNLSANALERTNLKNATVVVCSKDARGQVTAKLGTRSDIMPGDRVVIYARYINNRLVFVYKQ